MEPVIVIQTADDGESEPASGVEPESRFSHLPEPIHLEDTITSADTVERSGPEYQRDPEVDFMLRYGMP